MKKNTKITTGIVGALAALSIGAVAFAGSANSNEWELKDDLKAGAPTASANPTTGAEVKIDQHDNVQKKEGEQAGLVDEKTKKSYFSIEVTNTKLVDHCKARVGDVMLKPERTKFLVLDVEASLSKDVPKKISGTTDELFMPLIAEAFSVVKPDGKIDRNLASEMSWGCFDDAVLLPALVNPGQSVKGKVVLDVDTTRGKVAFDPENNGGWSWPFGG